MKTITKKQILNSIGLAMITMLCISVFSLVLTYFSLEDKTIYQFAYDEGVFTLNGKHTGYGIISLKHLPFNLVILALSFLVIWKKDNRVKSSM